MESRDRRQTSHDVDTVAQMTFPGPEVLGRGVVVSDAGRSPLEGAERIVVDESVLADSEELEQTVQRLHRMWVRRRPVTVELGVEASELRRPVVEERAPWMLGPGYTPLLDRLHFLVWANNWDARRDDPVWWWSRKAQRLGARVGGRADIILPGGKQAWVDGGPRTFLNIPVVHSQTVEQRRLTLQPATTPTRADLADDQRAAVEHLSGPVRVIAPAGSGKTRTLGARALHLVDERRVEPGIVTAVAYNNRAALQMRRRLGRDDLHIRTIHSLGWAIIRDVRPDAALLDERGVRARLRDMIPKAPRPNTDIIGPYLEGLAEIRIALRDPIEVEEGRNDVEGLAGILSKYRFLLHRRNEFDYDEQIYGAIELLLADPQLRRRWQRRCRHLLVDEFQDLTPAYLLLLRLLASPELSVFAVGDDDQTIYGYAGADPRFLIDFDRFFPGAGASALTLNYRCPAQVVTAASRLLSHNHIRVDKTIEAAAEPEPGGFRIITPDRPQMAVETQKVISHWLSKEVPAEQIAVLARVNSALLPMLAALDQAGIPFRSQLDTGLLNRTTIRATLAWIRLALNTDSMRRGDLMEAVRRPARRINRLASDLIPPGDISLHQLSVLGKGLDERREVTWGRFVHAIEEAAHVADQGNSGVLLDYLSQDTRLGKVAHALDSKRNKVDRSTHTDDLVALRRTATLYEDLSTFESSLRGLLGRKQSTEKGIIATSIHRVKGLEWDRVIVFGVDKGLIPHLLTDDLEEERRVLHVAITRCRRQVVVVSEKGRESPFLPELANKFVPSPEGLPAPHPQKPGPKTPGTLRTKGSPWPESETPYDTVLYDALRDWRLGMAQQAEVPAFIIFYNRTLEEIARIRPRTEAELLQIPGIGVHKLTKYGQDVLDLVASHNASPSHVERSSITKPPDPSLPSPAQEDPLPPLSAEDSAVLDALRQWRGSVARENNLPPYVIFNNRTLEHIARNRPRSEEQLLQIHGVGAAKLEKYGQDILELAKSHQPS